jgi:hypothetical protein
MAVVFFHAFIYTFLSMKKGTAPRIQSDSKQMTLWAVNKAAIVSYRPVRYVVDIISNAARLHVLPCHRSDVCQVVGAE